MFLLILKAMHNGQITNDLLDATEVALRVAEVDQVSLPNLTGNGTFALFLFSLCFVESLAMPFEWELCCSCVGG